MDTIAGNTAPVTSLQHRAARLREALSGIGSFLAAGRRPDPLPALRDLAGDWLRAEEIEIVVPAGTRPLVSEDPCKICGPVVIGRRTVGRIEATRARPFDDDDRALLVALGQLIGGALEHATLQGQIEQYAGAAQANADTLERLLGFSRSVLAAPADPRELALQIATLAPEMVGADRASVLLLPPDSPDAPVLALGNGVVSTPERAREVREHGIAGVVLRERASLIIDETDTDRRWLGLRLSQNDTRTRCAMAVPLLWGDQPIGVLTVTTVQSRLFTTAHLNLLELVACHAALAIAAANQELRVTRLAAQLLALADDLDAAMAVHDDGAAASLGVVQGVAGRLRELGRAVRVERR